MKNLTLALVFISLLVAPQSWSQKFPTLGEIYDFNPGDEFHIAHYYCCNELSFQLEQFTVIKKYMTDNQVNYIIQRNVFDYLNTSPPELVDTTIFMVTDTLVINDPDSVIFTENDLLMTEPGLYQGRLICTHTYWILDALKIERYVPGCGQVFNGWKLVPGSNCDVVDSLIYYMKGEESWGKTLLGYGELSVYDRFRIHPNPAHDILYIESTDHDRMIIALEIRDAGGRLVYSCSTLHQIMEMKIHLDDQKLLSGIYFLYIRTEKGVETYKFIKD